jgi:tetratricopeptide (TPR) repeat protein
MAEGWTWLGGARLWYAWQRDTPYWTAREPLTRALELDPSDPQAHVWAMVLALKERRFSHADSLYRSAWLESGLSTNVLGPAARATLTAALGTSEDRLRFVDGLDSFAEGSVLLMGTAPANYTDDLPMARAIWRKVASSESHSETGRGQARNHLAYLDIGGGRWDDAETEFRAAAELTPDLTRIMRTWAAAIPALDRPTNELVSRRASLDAWDAPDLGSSQARGPGLYLPDELRPWVRTYLHGLLSARLGARREAEDAALALEQAQAPPDTLGIRTDLAREIRALVSIDAGRPEEALQLLEDSRLSVDILPRQFFALFYTRPLGRLLRAQLLQQLGRDEEALAWYANFAVAWGTEYVFNAPRYLGMAEVYERRETTSGPQSTTDASWRGGRMRTRSTSRWFRTCVTG